MEAGVARKHIVVVGSVNLDFVCSAPRIPSPGETIPGATFQTFNGGKGANQAVAVAKLGHPVAMVAKVSNDEFGNRLHKGLKDAGVGVRAVTHCSRVSCGVAIITTDSRGDNSIVVVPGANGELRPRDLENASAIIRSAGIILTQLEIPFETVEALARLAGRSAVPLMLDPAPARKLPPSLLRAVTFLTLNETETRLPCGAGGNGLSRTLAMQLARSLQSAGPRNVILKLGDRGACVLGGDGEKVFVPAFKVKAVDSTAAGDAFNGGLAVALMQGKDLREAAVYASAVAALSVTKMGAQPSMPGRHEVRKFLRHNPLPPNRKG
jgi:ribokinase